MKGMDSDMVGRTGCGSGSSGATSAMRRLEIVLAGVVAVKAETLARVVARMVAENFIV